MPFSEKQRRAAFAALRAKKKGKSSRAFEGMNESDLEDYAHSKMERSGHKKMSARDQSKALRGKDGG